MARLAVAMLAIVLATSAQALAAPPWSDPVTVSGPLHQGRPLALLETADERPVAVWDEGFGVAGGYAVAEPGGAAFGAPRALPAGGVSTPVTYGRDRLAIAVARIRRGGPDALAVATGSARTGFGRPVTVARPTPAA